MNEVVRNLPLRKPDTIGIIEAGPTGLGWTVIELAKQTPAKESYYFSEMKLWCIDNIKGPWFPIYIKAHSVANREKGRYDWHSAQYFVAFQIQTDAMLYKLVNGGTQVER